MAMTNVRALPSPFLSSVFINVKCKESRDARAKRCEQQRFPGTAAFQMAGSLCSSVLLVYLQHLPSPGRVQEGFTVRNYGGGRLPDSINHAPILTLFFLPSLLLSTRTLVCSDCSQIPGTGFPTAPARFLMHSVRQPTVA